MPKRHPPEVRAAAVAAVAAGVPLSEAARQFGVSKGRLSEWCGADLTGLAVPNRSGTDLRARTSERMAELIYDTVEDLLSTIRLQLQTVAREEWIAKQNAGDVAALLGAEVDRAVRLLAGFRPAESGAEPDPNGDPDIVDVTARSADDGAGVAR